MRTGSLRRNFWLMLCADILLLAFAWGLSNLVRFDFSIPAYYEAFLLKAFPLVIVTKLLSFYFFDLYRGMWRYTSIADLLNVIKASSVSSLFIVSFILFSTRFYGFSRSIFVIDWCFTIILISGFRLSVRLYFDFESNGKPWETVSRILRLHRGEINPESRRLIIIGAGDCGEKIYREIHDNARLRYTVVGFLDDDPEKVGMKIHGIPVHGPISGIAIIGKRLKADEALIAIPSASSEQMRNIVGFCNEVGIPFKVFPGMGELINGKVRVSAIRELNYSDLLGREVIKLDEERIGAYLAGRSVLVTGAGGSIGSELCRQICRFRTKKITLFERSESPLYELELELKQNFRDVEVVAHLADVRDRRQIEKSFEASRPQVVFHAAAYKHVPMLERQPWKAVKNNIQGTRNVVEISNRFGVEQFVFVSTDKAVRPVSAMGASKRVAEMLVQCQNGNGLSKTRFMIVRFGNVVGSIGSVIPLFKKQIEKGGPVTVTHPEMTRYFMTIPEACQLILQTGSMGEGGEIFVLEMGTPVKIDDMARDLIRLSGFEPDVDIKIEYIGIRPGEKLYEELITEGEGIVPTSHEKIMVLSGTTCNLAVLNGRIDELALFAHNQDTGNIKLKLKEIISDYTPPEEVTGDQLKEARSIESTVEEDDSLPLASEGC